MQIFTDGSVNAKSKIGYGAYLLAPNIDLPLNSLKVLVKLKRFEQTSSTKLELQTLLWALNDIQASNWSRGINLTAYTDSQNIIGLPQRRESLEENNYYSNKNKKLNNYKLYQEFFRLASCLNCKFIKVAGHKPSDTKSKTDTVFGLVDLAARRALRENI